MQALWRGKVLFCYVIHRVNGSAGVAKPCKIFHFGGNAPAPPAGICLLGRGMCDCTCLCVFIDDLYLFKDVPTFCVMETRKLNELFFTKLVNHWPTLVLPSNFIEGIKSMGSYIAEFKFLGRIFYCGLRFCFKVVILFVLDYNYM